MDFVVLHDELTVDPLGRGYDGMTDQQAAGSLNATDRQRERGIVPSHEIIDATAPSEWVSLTTAEKQRYQTLTGAGQVNVQSANVRAAFMAMFGAGTQTRTNLAALQYETVSRAAELGLGYVSPGDVDQARNGGY